MDYETRLKERVERVVPGAWADPALLVNAPGSSGETALEGVLALCDAQNAMNHALAREYASRVPKDWFVAVAERVAGRVLDLDHDEWHFRRFLELAEDVDVGLAARIVARGLTSPCRDVVEAANDASGRLPGGRP